MLTFIGIIVTAKTVDSDTRPTQTQTQDQHET